MAEPIHNGRLSRLYYWSRIAIQGMGLRMILMLGGYILIGIMAVVVTDSWMNAMAALRVKGIHTRDIISQIQNLRTSLARAESAQSTYLLTQRQEYIPAFKQQVATVRQEINQLNKMYKLYRSGADEQAQLSSQQLTTVQDDVEGKLTVMQLAVTMLSTGRDDRAVEIINAGDGIKRMEDFYTHSQQLVTTETHTLLGSRSQTDFLMSIGRALMTASILLALILLILVVKRFLAEIINKEDRSQELQREVARFEQKLAERTSLLETLALDYQHDVERERHKLSRELHDELGSILTASKMDISWVVRKIKDIMPEAATKLTKTMRYLDQGIEFKRRVVNELHPSLLSTFGLVAALRELITTMAERNHWKLTLSLPEETPQVSDALRLVVYRLVQESLNNATKYAQATEVSLSLIVDDSHVKLEITDNGIGMDTTKREQGTHGLAGMRHRVTAIGGLFRIESEPGQGMLTLALIPLNPESPVERDAGITTA